MSERSYYMQPIYYPKQSPLRECLAAFDSILSAEKEIEELRSKNPVAYQRQEIRRVKVWRGKLRGHFKELLEEPDFVEYLFISLSRGTPRPDDTVILGEMTCFKLISVTGNTCGLNQDHHLVMMIPTEAIGKIGCLSLIAFDIRGTDMRSFESLSESKIAKFNEQMENALSGEEELLRTIVSPFFRRNDSLLPINSYRT